MVDWLDPVEIAKDYDVFSKLLFTLFGAYLWEVFMTSDFEWSLLTRRRRFRWPLVSIIRTRRAWNLLIIYAVFFFLCRYCMLLALVGLITSMTVSTKVLSFYAFLKALYTFNSWTGNMAILCASTSLMLRSVALWERRRSIILILGIPCLAHWTILYRGMFVVIAQWNPETRNCIVVQTKPSLLNTTFFFTMAFDFLILVFTAIALLGRHSARTDLWRLLFQDGLVYFLISFSTNCIPAVLNILNLNGVYGCYITYVCALAETLCLK
ncbi:hypothetical protein CPB83DRAFT_756352 [Crepidotus variabilis]|uniref:Uncharacterized protein n=1 Tax=Crepidotus variabilis TaxID=179855 RepID=A0A9P6ETK7_9AGAR|nr:hypothetical protein CPB83DRAFT_756352 [Crepidotus variabilis]